MINEDVAGSQDVAPLPCLPPNLARLRLTRACVFLYSVSLSLQGEDILTAPVGTKEAGEVS